MASKRKQTTHLPNKLFLIFCEGETEVWYLKSICKEWDLLKNVTIEQKDTNLKNIVKKVKDEKKDKTYDQIWFVWDFNQEDYNTAKKLENFKQALDQIKGPKMHVAISVPQIEMWFLCHYSSSTKSLNKKESEDAIKTQLRISSYEKKYSFLEQNIFPGLAQNFENAISNAKQIEQSNQKSTPNENFTNPSSTVYKLIEELLKLRESKLKITPPKRKPGILKGKVRYAPNVWDPDPEIWGDLA